MHRTTLLLATLLLAALGAPAAHAGMSEAERRIWSSPAFQRQFIQSYMAETEIEPRVNEDDRDVIRKVLEFMSSDRPDRAEEMLRRTIDPTTSALFDFLLANIHFQEERFDEAVAGYETAVDKYPKFRRAWRNLGLIHVRRSRYDAAIAPFTRVIELGGGDAITYGLLGIALSNVGNDVSAESAFRMANLLDPATPEWKMGLARSFFRQERYADAVALCERMISDEPERAELWLLQANAYVGLGRPVDAVRNLEIVDQLGESTPASLNMMGDIYVNEEMLDIAAGYYIRAMETSAAGRPTRAIRAANALADRGATDEARRLVERIEGLRGNLLDTEDRKSLLKLQVRMAVAQGEGDEEARVLEEIVELDPLDGDALILLGQHARRHEDPDRAAIYFERAAGLEQYEREAKKQYAQMLVGLREYDAALPLLRRVQAIEFSESVQDYVDQVERLAGRSR